MDFMSLKRINENSSDKIKLICRTLSKILVAILKDPEQLAPRTLKLDSDEVAQNLMPYSGGLEILFEIGFEEVSWLLFNSYRAH